MTNYKVENIKVGKLNLNETKKIIESINLVKELKKVDISNFFEFQNDFIERLKIIDDDYLKTIENINILETNNKIIIKFTEISDNKYIILTKILLNNNNYSWDWNFYTIDREEKNLNYIIGCSYVIIFGAFKRDIEDIEKFEELLKKEEI